MYEKRLVAGLGGAAARAARILTVLSTVILGAGGANAQKSGFVPSPPRLGDTVSVSELQISSKAKDRFERGLKSLERNDPEGSLKQFAAAIEAAPNYYEAYYHKGVAEAQLGRNQEAMHSFQAAVDLSDGHYPRAEFGYALVLSREGHAAEAERIVRHGLQAAPNIPDGHVVLGVVLLDLHRVDEAQQSARSALLLHALGTGKGHLILADICAARSDFAGQSSELQAYLDAKPQDRHRDLKAARDAAKELAKRMEDGR